MNINNRNPFERLPRDVLDNIFRTQLDENLDDITNFARASPRFFPLVQEYMDRIYTVNQNTNVDQMQRDLNARGLNIRWINYQGVGRTRREHAPLENRGDAERLLLLCPLVTQIHMSRVIPSPFFSAIAAIVSTPPIEYIHVDWNSCRKISPSTKRHFFAANFRFNQTITTITFPPGNWERIVFRRSSFNPEELEFDFGGFIAQFPRLNRITYT